MKFLLAVLTLITAGLLLRAAQLQIIQRADWTEKAADSLRRTRLTETVRGDILDVKGRVLAHDVACIDACVDYRAVEDPPDEDWVRKLAQQRLRDRPDPGTRAERAALLTGAIAAVRRDIEAMWDELARMPGATPESVAAARRDIVQKVVRRQRALWYRSYAKAMDARAANTTTRPAWYRSFLDSGNDDALDIKDYESAVGDQREAHPILRNLSADVNNHLAKNASQFPGLVLRSGIAREYPYHDAAAQVLGYIARVSKPDLDADTADDELREYQPSDTIGRTGLEALLEPQLRGFRGREMQTVGSPAYTEQTPARPGANIRTTVDIELCRRLQDLFANAEFQTKKTAAIEHTPLHGAAVVLDLATNEVRAMVSYPAYDPNDIDAGYAKLALDEINRPLTNRATQDAYEPGSTVKPMIGLGALAEGLLKPDDTIECTGYLVIGGKKYSYGRCWTMSGAFHTTHRFLPSEAPHPTGLLTYTDAIERSCNVFFETCGDRLGIDGEGKWLGAFGLGRFTGIGISESAGLIPGQLPAIAAARRGISWSAGIGQGQVRATPIQMANVAATIARNGTWIRPHLVPADNEPRVSLGLPEVGLRAAREGMTRVVNSRAGSGNNAQLKDILVAGKTGTAQAAPFTYVVRDDSGNAVLDAQGNAQREELAVSTEGQPNPVAPWYRGTGESGTDKAHSWFIGFAPANDPKIAFCVRVEYGGSGGLAAGRITQKLLRACIEAGYLPGGVRADDSVGEAR